MRIGLRRAMLWCAAAYALPTGAGAATQNADAFWLIPVSAREMAVGQAVIANVDDATAFHWNPAGLGRMTSLGAVSSYTSMVGGLASHQMLAAGMPVGNQLVLGASWVRLGVDDIPVLPALDYIGSDEREYYAKLYGSNPLGYMNYSHDAFTLTLARDMNVDFKMGWSYLTLPLRIPVGVSVKYFSISSGDSVSASGIGFDAGGQVSFDVNRALDTRALGEITLGAALSNVAGTKITWDTPKATGDPEYSDKLEMALAWGASYRQPLQMINSSVIVSSTVAADGSAWGIEYWYRDIVALRAGRDMLDTTSRSIGAGVAYFGFGFDYAIQWHPLGITHRVSLQYTR